MSRKDYRETEAMLARLQSAGISRQHAEALRRISMTLQRWFEAECGNSNDYCSWGIEREGNENDSPPCMVTHTHQGNYGWSVWCLDDADNPECSAYVRATRKTFPAKDAAIAYMNTVAVSRKPELRQVLSKSVRIADRETGARKRLTKIMADYPTLAPYVQTDPRGCALYILRPGDVPEGEDASAYYSRGLAVYR